MKKSVGVVVPFYNTPMWVQTSLWGLINTANKYRDKYDVQILLVDNTSDDGYRSYKKETIDAIKLVPELADKVTILKNPEGIRFHGTSLDTAVRFFNTDYLLCWETDIAIFSDDWLDWIMGHIEDPKTWMAGYELLDFHGTKNSHIWYVMPNPGIYRMDILKEIDAEVKANLDFTHYWGENYCKSKVLDSDANCEVIFVKEIGFSYGAFSERRGFKETHPNCPDGKGVFARQHSYNYENGQWLFYRMMRDSRNLQYKVLEQYRKLEQCNGEITPMYSEFGGGLFKHFWAGTRSWDFMTHPEANLSQINYVREKIKIEIDVWNQIVPERIRRIVPEVYNSCRNDEFEYNNLRYIHDNHQGNLASQILSLDIANWYKREFLDTNFQNLLR
jgi:hypothetical protein